MEVLGWVGKEADVECFEFVAATVLMCFDEEYYVIIMFYTILDVQLLSLRSYLSCFQDSCYYSRSLPCRDQKSLSSSFHQKSWCT